jgi:flagellar protein FlgJ
MNLDSSGMLSLGQFQKLQNRVQQGKNRLTAEQQQRNDERLKEACKDFQSIFVKQMLDAMRKTVNEQGLLYGGRAEEIFEDMLYEKYAQKISDTAGLGLDEMMYDQLSQKKPSLD